MKQIVVFHNFANTPKYGSDMIKKNRCKEKGGGSCPGPGGKNAWQESYHRMELRNRNRCYSMGKEEGGRDP